MAILEVDTTTDTGQTVFQLHACDEFLFSFLNRDKCILEQFFLLLQ